MVLLPAIQVQVESLIRYLHKSFKNLKNLSLNSVDVTQVFWLFGGSGYASNDNKGS